MSDFITKVRQIDESSEYKTMLELPLRSRNIKAVIRAAKMCNSPYLYQVLTRNSEMYFTTLAEAKGYCKECGWL